METSGWLSDFSDEAVDAAICVETRTALGMSGSPMHKWSKIPGPPRGLCTRSLGSMNLRRIEKYVPEMREPNSTTAMRIFVETLIGFVSPPKFQLAAIDRRACGRTRRAAIDEDLRALDIRRVVGGEEQHGFCDLFRFAEASERNG